MSIFKKLFKKSSDSESSQNKDTGRSKYMPEEKLPLDERFIHNFTSQGGRFLYSLDESEVQANFEDVLVEHDFFETNVLCTDLNLRNRFNGFNLRFSDVHEDCSFFLTTCEYIISDNGAILFSSNQLKEKKPVDFPETMIVLATASQIVESIGEGLRGIKHRSGSNIPTNITTLKNFEEPKVQEKKDLMNYGVPNKRVYLILLEDL
ncbi:LUD domain-containing protein [Nonlabens ulvanivorans]|uniref:LUD domain-containing protein n=1 Tax=Nonlabens ulvanivorans TaxID=906888 RepID=UPI0032679FEF